MEHQHNEGQERLMTAIYFKRGVVALRAARALTSWAVVFAILGVGGWHDTSAVVPLGLLAAIMIPARLKIGVALDNLIWARDQFPDLPDPDVQRRPDS